MLVTSPSIVAEDTTVQTKGRVLEAASQSWVGPTLVQFTGTGGAPTIQRAAAAATVLAGLVTTSAFGSAALPLPPAALTGEKNHLLRTLKDAILEISVTDSSASGANIGASGVTWSGAGTNGVALAPGQQYGILLITSGANANIQTLNVQNTTQKVFEIVAIKPGVSVTEPNPRVLVRVIPSAIQA